MKTLYHYSSNLKCFSILQEKTIRLCDIRKGNDYNEMQIFFPDIFPVLRKNYLNNPFPFTHKGKKDSAAVFALLELSEAIWHDRFLAGDFSNFVMCFSEECDSLSQWRGYADNGKGGCIGFSYDMLMQYCSKSNGVLRLEKVEYPTKKEVEILIEKYSNELLIKLKALPRWIIDNITKDENEPLTERLISFNFHGMLESLFVDSLKYKAVGFSEEKEWRIFFAKCAYKNPEWVIGNQEIHIGPEGFAETISLLKNKIEFHITSDDIIAYLPVKFFEFEKSPIEELWIGPNNKISKSDIELFMKQYGYTDAKVEYSDIPYR